MSTFDFDSNLADLKALLAELEQEKAMSDSVERAKFEDLPEPQVPQLIDNVDCTPQRARRMHPIRVILNDLYATTADLDGHLNTHKYIVRQISQDIGVLRTLVRDLKAAWSLVHVIPDGKQLNDPAKCVTDSGLPESASHIPVTDHELQVAARKFVAKHKQRLRDRNAGNDA